MDSREPPPRAHEASLVRPYTLTAGRTSPSVELPLEAPVQTLRSALFHQWPPHDMRGKIIQLCTKSPSVAEISARLDVPLGVARVLVGDLVTSGYLRVQPTLNDHSTQDERRELIGRTLRGLRAL
ncbi:DUF742 domain-containing protein [Mycobacterium heckeshornense]|uniref:Uncharacterized protein n=1 Tax=Mycobacterium heckeshornense TaxID=110505 RepID=A0A2G8B8C3_9MYCO|nr:DUF742 domain-containing protein [Mycobacterium heckeshornense]KMV22120.1 hypothetical protein ACT16_12600 [Mycobacterium heckeshornense]MCV7033286.1 DUF742 domain-containing protein [Mycobacterium heckeshornense]PIJ34035.1 DUF742 domain-containing protein [Mycobacterium heckeshornense]BCO37429.1 hypothetical protein MHEC_38620 [Mycobacterium heckeshornense]BCQ10305.1 hypothetical protein JMUB5695_03760 [Mycobacterium heckeshornense]